jgi:thiol-disulfide isomerase/thioredoxin
MRTLIVLLITCCAVGFTTPEDNSRTIRIFSGKFCPPCRKQEEIMKRPAIQAELKRYEQFKYLDVNDFPEFQKYGVTAVPTLIIEKGQVSTRLVGLQTEAGILKALKDD